MIRGATTPHAGKATLSARQRDIVFITRHTQGSFVHPSTIEQSTIPVYLCPDDVTCLADHGRSTWSLDLWVLFENFVSCPLSRAKGLLFFVSFTFLLLRDDDAIVVIVSAIFNFPNHPTYTFRFLFCTSPSLPLTTFEIRVLLYLRPAVLVLSNSFVCLPIFLV